MIAKELATKLAEKGLGVLGTNVFYARLPQDKIPAWVVVAAGGNPPVGNFGVIRQDYGCLVKYHTKSSDGLYAAQETLANALGKCEQFDGGSICEVLVTPLSDEDQTSTEVHVGTWSITIKTIKEK